MKVFESQDINDQNLMRSLISEKNFEGLAAAIRKGKGLYVVDKEDCWKSFSIVACIIDSASFSEKEKVELIRIAIETLGSNEILKENIGLAYPPLTYAIKHNMLEVAQGIINFLDKIDLYDIKILIEQQKYYSFDCVPLLKAMLLKVEKQGDINVKSVNLKDIHGRTLIFTAIDARSMEAANCLIGMGADLNVIDTHGDTLLMHACFSFKDCILEKNEYLTFVEFLCSKNNVNHKNKNGSTALHWAARWNPLLVECLLKHGADANVIAFDGSAPLDERPSSSFRNEDEPIRYSKIQALLKQAGALPDPFQETFLKKATQFVQDNKAFAEKSSLLKEHIGKRTSRREQGKLLLQETKVKNEQNQTDKQIGKQDETRPVSIHEKTIKAHNHYKKVLWSFMQRQSRSIFSKMLDAKKSAEQQSIVYETFDGITLPFLDFTKQSNYRFIVHTTQTREDRSEDFEKLLRQLASNDPALFIKKTPYFSCSLIDKNTGLGRMGHQTHDIFPIALIIDAADDAVFRAYPCDIHSPYGRVTDQKRREYLKLIEDASKNSDIFEGQLRSTETLNSRSIEDIMSGVNLFLPTDINVHQPFLTPDRVLRTTHDTFYNELIVLGHPKNRVMGIAVEKEWLDMFNYDFAALSSEAMKEGPLRLLGMLARFLEENPNFPLILVNTNEHGYHLKKPVDLQMQGLLDAYAETAEELEQVMLKAYRFEQAISRLGDSQKTTPLYQTYTQKLAEKREQLREKTAILQDLEVSIIQNRGLVEEETAVLRKSDKGRIRV